MSDASADPFLAVGLAILMFLMLIINVYIYVYWQHPEDKNESMLPKVVIIFGLQVTAVSVLLIPIDVANEMGNPRCDDNSSLSSNNVYCGGLDMFTVWEVFFCMLAFVVIVCLPFSIFYYEAGDVIDIHNPIQKSRFWPAVFQESVLVFAFLLLLLVLYFLQAMTQLPVQQISMHTDLLTSHSYHRSSATASPFSSTSQILTVADFIKNNGHTNATTPFQYEDVSINLPVNFPVYLIGLFGWFGWWFFALFAGVGLASLPFDLIIDFIYRPRILPPDVLANKELELQERSKDILEIVTLMKKERLNYSDGTSHSKSILRKRYINDRLEVNRLSQMVFLLEKEVEDLRLCKNIRHRYNPLIPYAKLGAGIFFSILSILWFLQIVLCILVNPPVTPFLSLYLLSFDSFFPMFGNLTYALLALYLLLCTVKGCFKLSVRSLCIKIHPMVVGGTYINAFLFNLAIVMFCTVPLVQFCVIAFQGYTVYTDAYLIFLVQVGNLQFFQSFYGENNVLIWMMLLIACVVLIYLVRYPRDVAMSTDDFRKNLFGRIETGGRAQGASSKKKGYFSLTTRDSSEVRL